MRSKLLVIGLIAAFMFVALPTNSFETSAQRRWRDRDRGDYSYGRYRRWDNDRYRRWDGRGRKKRYWGYKNYGQYRRTQVGNRRYRWERRYYYRDGNRFSRLIRIFF